MAEPCDTGRRNGTGRYDKGNAAPRRRPTKPFGPAEFANARERLDSRRWIPWNEISSVLCLSTPGGCHSALFASLGCRVVVAGSSPLDLQLDEAVARQNGFAVECVDCGPLEITRLVSGEFDLVYHILPASGERCLRQIYQSVHGVIRASGYYRVEHPSPFPAQLAAIRPWDGQAYRLAEPQIRSKPIPRLEGAVGGSTPAVCWEYANSLDDAIGGFCESGFTLLGFAEPAPPDGIGAPLSPGHRQAYLAPKFALFGRRRAPSDSR